MPVWKFRIVILLSSFSITTSVSAQLCEGSLGDPVVNIHFGAGNNPGPSLNGISQYSYIGTGCPNDGQYTLANSTGACFGDTWHHVGEDHTPGDSRGYMMVTNASYAPGTFFVDTVKGLCANTTFEFAAWIMNILMPGSCGGSASRPDVTFTLETFTGTVLKSYSTGSIPEAASPEWKQYGFFFATPPGIESVVVRMTNNAPGGCGNDLVIDDITFRACGPIVQSEVNGSFQSLDRCINNFDSLTMRADVSAGYQKPAFQWQVYNLQNDNWNNIAGANANVYTRSSINQAGNHRYRMKVFEENNTGVSSCFVTSNEITIRVHELPVPEISIQGACSGDTVLLYSRGGQGYLWQGPLGFQSHIANPLIPDASLDRNGWYYVNITDEFGCENIDSVQLNLAPTPEVDAGEMLEICRGEKVQLQAHSALATQFSWSPSEYINDPDLQNPIISPPTSTLYTVQAMYGGCVAYDTVRVIVYEPPAAFAGKDRVIISGDSLTLNGEAGGTGITISWSPRLEMYFPDSIAPVIFPSVSRDYILSVISNHGCGLAADAVKITVYQKLFVPNAFTPNGDGINDTWYIEALDAFPGASLKVYNRFGQVVFDNHQKNIPWDGAWQGDVVIPGVYVYVIYPGAGMDLIKGVVYVIR